jgi:MurNAc alpha-1-phosphate uridylyltransferase
MNAMIFAAGLGTRLKPLTDSIPKALVEVNGITMLEHSINLLTKHGAKKIVVNVHHHADQIINFINSRNHFGIEMVISDERDELLDTGGGLWKARKELETGGAFFVVNADILSNINLNKMMEEHLKSDAMATLAVRNRTESSRQLLFDENGRLGGWINTKTGEEILLKKELNLKPLAFSGIHVISPNWFELNNKSGKFSIIDSYLELGKSNSIKSYRHDEDYWFDIGSPSKLSAANDFFKSI